MPFDENQDKNIASRIVPLEKIDISTSVSDKSSFSMESDSKLLATILKSQNSEIKNQLVLYKRLNNWYGNKNLEQYIIKHYRESETLYKNRKEKKFVYNYIPSIIDTYIGFIFKKGVTRTAINSKELDEKIEEFKNKLAEKLRAQIAKEQEQLSNASASTQPEQTSDNKSNNTEQQPAPQQSTPQQSAQPQSDGNQQQATLTPEQQQAQSSMMDYQVQFLKEVTAKKEELIDQSTPPDLKAFWENVDRSGTKIDDYMQLLGTLAQLYGFVAVLVDLPNIAEKELPKNEKERLKMGYRPYLTRYLPEDIMDWELEESGDLTWIRVKDTLTDIDNTGPFKSKKNNKIEYYRTITSDSWYLHKVEKGSAELIDAGQHGLGFVPIVFMYNKKSMQDDIIGISAVRDILEINIAILNYISLMNEDIYQKCLSILVLNSDDDETKEVEIGSNNVFTYSGDKAPQFISPSTNPTEFISQQIIAAKEEISEISKRGGGSPSAPVKPIAGYAKEFIEANVALANKADNMEMAEKRIHEIFMTFFGLEWSGEVDYPDDFDVTGIIQELDYAYKSVQLIRSPSFRREMEKKIIRRMLPKATQRQLDKFDIETDLNEYIVPSFYPTNTRPGE